MLIFLVCENIGSLRTMLRRITSDAEREKERKKEPVERAARNDYFQSKETRAIFEDESVCTRGRLPRKRGRERETFLASFETRKRSDNRIVGIIEEDHGK